MAFADYEQVAEPLALPYRGKVYRLPELGIQDTIRLRLVLDPDSDEDMTLEELEELLLGDAGKQMAADNVPDRFRDRAFRTAVAEFRYSREMAEQVWNLPDGAPKAPTPTVEASVPSTSTGAASTTPSPAPGSTTKTSRRKPAPSATTSA